MGEKMKVVRITLDITVPEDTKTDVIYYGIEDVINSLDGTIDSDKFEHLEIAND